MKIVERRNGLNDEEKKFRNILEEGGGRQMTKSVVEKHTEGELDTGGIKT